MSVHMRTLAGNPVLRWFKPERDAEDAGCSAESIGVMQSEMQGEMLSIAVLTSPCLSDLGAQHSAHGWTVVCWPIHIFGSSLGSLLPRPVAPYPALASISLSSFSLYQPSPPSLPHRLCSTGPLLWVATLRHSLSHYAEAAGEEGPLTHAQIHPYPRWIIYPTTIQMNFTTALPLNVWMITDNILAEQKQKVLHQLPFTSFFLIGLAVSVWWYMFVESADLGMGACAAIDLVQLPCFFSSLPHFLCSTILHLSSGWIRNVTY